MRWASPPSWAPRFGSCYFLLSASATQRATLCYGDSHTLPACRGTHDCWEGILAKLRDSAGQDVRAGCGQLAARNR